MTAKDVVDDRQPIQFADLRFGPDEVNEMDGAQVMVKVSKAEIRRIALRHGFYSAHPLIQVVAGIVLTGIGVLPTWHFASWVAHGGMFVSPEAFAMAFMFLGPWLVYDAMKAGPFLEVQTVAGRKKLILDRGAEPAALEDYLTVVENRFGYVIDRGATIRRE